VTDDGTKTEARFDVSTAPTATASQDGVHVRLRASALNLIQIKNPVPKSRAWRNPHVKEVSLS